MISITKICQIALNIQFTNLFQLPASISNFLCTNTMTVQLVNITVKICHFILPSQKSPIPQEEQATTKYIGFCSLLYSYLTGGREQVEIDTSHTTSICSVNRMSVSFLAFLSSVFSFSSLYLVQSVHFVNRFSCKINTVVSVIIIIYFIIL